MIFRQSPLRLSSRLLLKPPIGLRTATAQGWAWNRACRSQQSSQGSPAAILSEATARSPKLARLEAAFFVAEAALSPRRLVQVATLADAREAVALIEELNTAYDAEQSAFRIERVASGYRMLTRAQLAPWLDRIHHRQERLKLSAPLMETLSIIAYRQPCTRADVEAVRGVQSAEIIKQLMERHLVRITGEDDSLGRPYLYGTTRLFLETFGLSSLEELPMSEHLRRIPAQAATEEASGEQDGSAEPSAA